MELQFGLKAISAFIVRVCVCVCVCVCVLSSSFYVLDDVK